ncbi:NAD(P)/FAD-dependent oxidoreductase [Pseudalkalibacillus hwajinpoensis]|uniref:NAD(P)/FAD-dependent oxidoreductase n=1 Tax=Guptibacillus hwajinpoensis TaxID=208199 RepID=UPI001CFF1B33
MNSKKDLLIIGGGPAGISAAIWAKRLGLNHLLLEEKKDLGGQLNTIYNQIVDYPGIIAPNGKYLKKQFKKHADEIKFEYALNSPVKSINWEKKILKTSADHTYEFRALLIATGSSPRKLDVPGEQEMIDQNEVYSATRDKGKFINKNVAVIGGGDRAFEGALLLAEAGAKVTLIHRSTHFKARQEFKDPVLEHENITILTETIVNQIEGKGKALSLSSKGLSKTIEVEGIFIRIGVQPNTNPYRQGIEMDQEGYIKCNAFGETSLPYVYAAGDVCTRPLLSSIASSVGQGMTSIKQLSFFLEN